MSREGRGKGEVGLAEAHAPPPSDEGHPTQRSDPDSLASMHDRLTQELL